MSTQLGYLWAAATVVWLGTCLYMVSVHRRQSRVNKEMEALLQQAERDLKAE